MKVLPIYLCLSLALCVTLSSCNSKFQPVVASNSQPSSVSNVNSKETTNPQEENNSRSQPVVASISQPSSVSNVNSEETTNPRDENKGKYFYIASRNDKTSIATFYKTSLYDGTQKKICSFKVPNLANDFGGYISGDNIFYSVFNPVPHYIHFTHNYNYITQKDQIITPGANEEEFQIVDNKIYYYDKDYYICTAGLDGSNPLRIGKHTAEGGCRLFYIYKNYLFYLHGVNCLYMVNMSTNKEIQIQVDNIYLFLGGENDKIYIACSSGIYCYSIVSNELTYLENAQCDNWGFLYNDFIYQLEDNLTVSNLSDNSIKTVANNVGSFFVCGDNLCYRLKDSKGNVIPNKYYVDDLKGNPEYLLNLKNDGTVFSSFGVGGTDFSTVPG